MFWLAKAQEERNTDVDIRAQLAARVFSTRSDGRHCGLDSEAAMWNHQNRARSHCARFDIMARPPSRIIRCSASILACHPHLRSLAKFSWNIVDWISWPWERLWGYWLLQGALCCTCSKQDGWNYGHYERQQGLQREGAAVAARNVLWNVLSWTVYLPAEQVGWSGWFVLSTAWGPNCVRRMWQAGWQQELGTWVVIRIHDLNSLVHHNLASEVVSSLEEALDVHECLVTLRSLASRRSEAQGRAMPMEVRQSFLLGSAGNP